MVKLSNFPILISWTLLFLLTSLLLLFYFPFFFFLKQFGEVLQAPNVAIPTECYSIADTKTNNKRKGKPPSNSEREQASQGRRKSAMELSYNHLERMCMTPVGYEEGPIGGRYLLLYTFAPKFHWFFSEEWFYQEILLKMIFKRKYWEIKILRLVPRNPSLASLFGCAVDNSVMHCPVLGKPEFPVMVIYQLSVGFYMLFCWP